MIGKVKTMSKLHVGDHNSLELPTNPVTTTGLQNKY